MVIAVVVVKGILFCSVLVFAVGVVVVLLWFLEVVDDNGG
jgi:hypothetical protein